ncbi:MAG: site-specific DNA-methyltransferase [Chloroflexi bacterium]|nr:site-specific DNA-methyltransferase [Chloroflexota bacterium]
MHNQLDLLSITRPLTADSLAIDALFTRPYLTTSRGVLFNNDCLKVLPHIKDESINTVFADPPFNLGKDYANGLSDQLDHDEYLNWCFHWINECIRVLVPGGALFIYNIPRHLIPIGAYLNAQGMLFRHWIALTMKNTYPRGKTLYPAHYGLLYYTKGEPRTFTKLRLPIPTCRHCGKELHDYGGHRDKLNDEGLNLTDFWEDTSPVRHRKFKTRVANELKPMIPERAILISTVPGEIVLDPFGGGGSTFQMAEKHGRNWIGTEIGPCEPIVERLNYMIGVKVGDTCPDEVLACFQ